MANGVGQFRAIQRIEMDSSTPCFAQALDLFDRHVRGIIRRVSGSSSNPSKRWRSHAGTDAPQRSAKRKQLWKRVIGKMPVRAARESRGGTSIAIPPKYVRLGRKNLVIARLAPASTLRFKFSRSAIDAAGLRVAFRVRRTDRSEFPDSPSPSTRSDA